MGLREQFTLEEVVQVGEFQSRLSVKKSASKTKSSVQSRFALPGTDINRAFRALCILEERKKWDGDLIEYSDTVDPHDLDIKQIVVRYPSPMLPREMHYKRSVERCDDEIVVHNRSLREPLPRLASKSVLRLGVDVKMWIRRSPTQTLVELCIIEPRNRAPIPIRMVRSYILKSLRTMVLSCVTFLLEQPSLPYPDCKTRLLSDSDSNKSDNQEEASQTSTQPSSPAMGLSPATCDKAIVTEICSVTLPLLPLQAPHSDSWHTIEEEDEPNSTHSSWCCFC